MNVQRLTIQDVVKFDKECEAIDKNTPNIYNNSQVVTNKYISRGKASISIFLRLKT